ncbi:MULTISPECIES: AAA family ATPase [unclassified Staphylococcus]|uniref:AAA family ATPase n=1 Tax=unclassified Staphylococcus TaxID=91994 RepID=UPI00187F3217|nr:MULTISPECIES: AAA family ATPase [unclassified Staphylococcus]MBF2758422.1 AAA family ATPase [Staphylococcus haemolyticus]MBF2774807.1 AAA family ATPase [Staphylococcus haemolyticus]MBF2777094.1 AAA family ATPase [Staphylococcus haemolyticus]MBF2816688.1 AAA family ATPase [Staphylococcus haemolyticus]MBF9721223.1 AAA family ATPase [Staphylococcus haemolyticus]
MNETILNKLVKYIEVGFPLVFVENSMYSSQNVINNLYDFQIKDNIYIYNSLTNQHYDFAIKENENITNLNQISKKLTQYEVGNNLIVLKGFETELAQEDIETINLLADVSQNVIESIYKNLTLVFIGDNFEIPEKLKKYSVVINKELPSYTEIHEIVRTFLDFQVDDLDMKIRPPKYLINALIGLNEFEIEQTLAMLFYENSINLLYEYEIKEKILEEINEMKSQFIKKNGTLSIVENLNSFNDIGGLKELKSYINETKLKYDKMNQLKEMQINLPKGVLILGKPGNGKSLLAKATASEMKMPLIKFDISKILGKYVGESEKKMQSTLQIVQTMSPCVLWIDEIEKTFAGINNENNDTMRKILGLFLTWMSDDNKSVFVVATANTIDNNIPPELIRKGRFDEIFYVDNPSSKDRKIIFNVHLQKRGINISNNNLEIIANKSTNLSGAEIEYVCNKVASKYYMRNTMKSFSENNIINEILDSVTQVVKEKDPIEYTEDLNEKRKIFYEQNKELIEILNEDNDDKKVVNKIFKNEIDKFLSNKVYDMIWKLKSDEQNKQRFKKA